VSPMGATWVTEVRDGVIEEYQVTPGDLGLDPVQAEEIAGGEPAENAAMIEAVLSGAATAARTAVVMNAAAALLVGDAAASWEGAARLAETTIDSGRAREALERLREAASRVSTSG